MTMRDGRRAGIVRGDGGSGRGSGSGSGSAVSVAPDAGARAHRLALVARICEHIAGAEDGPPMHVHHAAVLEGVHRQRLYEWRKADQEIDLMLSRASAIAARKRVAEVREAALGLLDSENGKANANVLLSLLERAHPEEWGPARQRIESTLDVSQRVAQLTAPEMRDAVADAVAADAELVAVLLPRLLEDEATRRAIADALRAIDAPALEASYDDE